MPKNNNNNTTYLQYYMTLKYREERIRFHTHTLTHTHARVRAHRRRRHPSPLGSRFRLPPPLSLHTLASGMTGGGDGVTQGIKKKPSGRRRPPDGRYGKGGGGPAAVAVPKLGRHERPSGTHTHTHTQRRTHARVPADAVVRTRRDQSSRMRTFRPPNGSCSACTRPGPGPSRPARYRAPRRRCGPHAREPVRGRPPPCRVTYRAVV